MIKHLILLKTQTLWISRWTCSNGLQFFDKKTSCGTVNNEIISDKELAEELHKHYTNKLLENLRTENCIHLL